MSNAYLVVAIFDQADGTFTGPHIWAGHVGESPSEVKAAWRDNASNYGNLRQPVVSHILEVDPHGHTKGIRWDGSL